MKHMKKWVTVMIAACAMSASANVITNGSFEVQPPVGTFPVGWVSSLDGASWVGQTDDAAKTNSVFKYASSWTAADGDYFIRQTMLPGSAAGTLTSFWSTFYNTADLPVGTVILRLDLQSINYVSPGEDGKMRTYGSVVFYDGADGTGNALATNETAYLTATNEYAYSFWKPISGTFPIPAGAQSYKIGANVEVDTTLDDYAYPRFDAFTVTALTVDPLMDNGSFETQPPVGVIPVGWANSLDGNYWVGQTDSEAKTNSVFKYSSSWVAADGDYFIRRTMFSGSGAGTLTSFWSAFYNTSDLPVGTVTLKLDLQSINYVSPGEDGKMRTYGSIVFYDGADGTGNALATNETAYLTATNESAYSFWQPISGTFPIPAGAQSYKIGANVEVDTKLGDYAYPRFDDFVLSAGGAVPATFIGITAVAGGMMEIEIYAPTPGQNYLKSKTDLVIEPSWIDAPHSYTNDVGTLEYTNLTYSIASGTNRLIYVQADESSEFFIVE